ncbi:GDP-mannose 4,6-dehydratase [Streptomyces sp. NPDC005096]|uniref:GDP-mannose 4,6-dehydratase n=1 Tax=Streptomyces sp. NPDC005096 TaxID=3154559 RepID=UPI0033A734FE
MRIVVTGGGRLHRLARMWLAPRCRSRRRTPGTASAASFTSPARGCTAPSARAHGPEEGPPAPNSPYSASKSGSDLLALAYHRAHGLDAVVTRCSNNYEPYQFLAKAIPLFITNLIAGNTVPLNGDGRSIRDWLHVSDHCRGIELVLRGGKAGELYHIGGGT